jgi:sulfur carrier protein
VNNFTEEEKPMSIPLITLYVNGEVQTCPPHLNLVELLEYLNLNPRLVAVEYNGEIRHRQFWETTIVVENDRLEIVTIVGGGCP